MFFNFFFNLCGGTLGTAAITGLLYQPRMIGDGDGDCGEIGGMKISRGNRSTRRKPAPAPLCPPQIPTSLDPRLNPGPPATNRLSYGAAKCNVNCKAYRNTMTKVTYTKNETRFLYIMKQLNKTLHILSIDNANKWGSLWNLIHQNITG
jgi:hypothetical protein